MNITNQSHIAFIGLGAMGYPMAGHLVDHFNVQVFNRTTQKAKQWSKQFEQPYQTNLKHLVHDADVVIACVGNDDDVYAITAEEGGVFTAIKKDAVFIDHTTTSAELARNLSNQAKQRGLHYLDAPVSGGQSGAENGALTIMVGGEPAIFERCQNVLSSYSRYCRYMGASGAGQLTKMVNQICIAGLVQGLSEAVAFSKNAKLNPYDVFDVIAKGAAQSWQMDNRHKTMIENTFDYGFAVDWMRKDLGLCLKEAQNNGSSLPITALVDQLYRQVQANGGNRFDTSSLVTLLPTKES